MKKFKSIELVRAFPTQKIPFLVDFIHRNCAHEVDLLLKYAIDSNVEDEGDEEIWTNIFNEVPFNKQQFANYCHQLINGVEQAMCLHSLKKKDLKYYDVLLPVLLEWDLLDHFQFTRRKASRLLGEEKANDYSAFYKHRIDYLQFISLEKESSRKTDLNINEASDCLDEYYIILKLRYLCAAQSHQNISSAVYNVQLIEMLIPFIRQSHLAAHPLIKNYLLVYRLLKDPDDVSNFHDLKTQLFEDRALFSKAELNEIYIYPINFCVQKINNGFLSYGQELLEIYKSLPGFDIDSEEIISPWRFRNVVQLALMAGDFEWAEFFIEQFSHRVLQEYRENAMNYNMANLRFHQKRYVEVIPLLIHVEYQDINYALICKILLLKSYYEMKELEAFYSLLESFRLYLTRSQKLTGIQRKQYLDLLSILRQLAKKEYASREAIDKFKVKIRKREIIADKGWILEQLESL